MEDQLLTTEYYLSYDLVNDQIMFSNNADEPIAPASLTKFLTKFIVFILSILVFRPIFVLKISPTSLFSLYRVWILDN